MGINTAEIGITSIRDEQEAPAMAPAPTAPIKEFVEDSTSELDKKYAIYQENGGELPIERYEQFSAMQQTLREGNGQVPGTNQAEHMANRAGVELTPEEVFAYRYFRNMMRSPEDHKNSEKPSQRDVYNLPDQILLVEVLRMGGRADASNKIVSSYPNIFNENSEESN